MSKFFRVVLLLIASIVIGLLIRNARLNKFDENSSIPPFNGLTLGSDTLENPGGLEFYKFEQEEIYKSGQKVIYKPANLDSLGFDDLGIQPVYYYYYKNRLFRIEIRLQNIVPKYAFINSKLTELFGERTDDGIELRDWIKEKPIDYKTAKKALNKLLGVSQTDLWETKKEKVSLYSVNEQYIDSVGNDIEITKNSFFYVIEYRSKTIGKHLKDLPRIEKIEVHPEIYWSKN